MLRLFEVRSRSFEPLDVTRIVMNMLYYTFKNPKRIMMNFDLIIFELDIVHIHVGCR